MLPLWHILRVGHHGSRLVLSFVSIGEACCTLTIWIDVRTASTFVGIFPDVFLTSSFQQSLAPSVIARYFATFADIILTPLRKIDRRSFLWLVELIAVYESSQRCNELLLVVLFLKLPLTFLWASQRCRSKMWQSDSLTPLVCRQYEVDEEYVPDHYPRGQQLGTS